MIRTRKGIRPDLAELFQKNVPMILSYTGYCKSNLAKECGVSRQAIYNILNNNERHVTAIQFLAIMQVLAWMIYNSNMNSEKTDLAKQLWTEVNQFYRTNGIKMAE